MYKKVLKEMKRNGLDAILIVSPENMRYVSGFTGEGVLYLSEKRLLIITDFRYIISAKRECEAFEIIDAKGNKGEILNKCITKVGERVGFESSKVTVAEYRKWKKQMKDVQWVPVEDVLAGLRSIKNEEEIRKIAQAEMIGDEAFKKILDVIKIGMSEREITWQLERMMKELGAEGLSFDIIAASGIHSSMPHARSTDKKIQNGDFLTLDFGCKVDGYCSDMTRTVIFGKADSKQKMIYNLVLEAQEAALRGIHPGMRCREVDAMARSMIEKEGYGSMFGHGLGHSVGLEIHEEPRFSPNVETVIEPGMVITVEPGIYMEDLFGVRIEDLVVITENGHHNLTHSTKELIQL